MLLCYPNCSTCKKAQAWLESKGLSPEYRNIKTDPPTEEELRRVKPSQEPILISQFLELVMNAIGDTERKRLSHTTITNWLILKGFLQKQESPDGKSKRLPTQAGEQLGLTVRTREGQYGTYQAVYYSQGAQQFLLDHLQDILHPGK